MQKYQLSYLLVYFSELLLVHFQNYYYYYSYNLLIRFLFFFLWFWMNFYVNIDSVFLISLNAWREDAVHLSIVFLFLSEKSGKIMTENFFLFVADITTTTTIPPTTTKMKADGLVEVKKIQKKSKKLKLPLFKISETFCGGGERDSFSAQNMNCKYFFFCFY